MLSVWFGEPLGLRGSMGRVLPPRPMAASPDEGSFGEAQWSPDGTRILFTRQVDIGGGQTKADLFQMRADGTDVIRVTNGPEDDDPADWGTYPLVD